MEEKGLEEHREAKVRTKEDWDNTVGDDSLTDLQLRDALALFGGSFIYSLSGPELKPLAIRWELSSESGEGFAKTHLFPKVMAMLYPGKSDDLDDEEERREDMDAKIAGEEPTLLSISKQFDAVVERLGRLERDAGNNGSGFSGGMPDAMRQLSRRARRGGREVGFDVPPERGPPWPQQWPQNRDRGRRRASPPPSGWSENRGRDRGGPPYFPSREPG